MVFSLHNCAYCVLHSPTLSCIQTQHTAEHATLTVTLSFTLNTLQLSAQSKRVIALEVELNSAKNATERASSDLAGRMAEKGRLEVEVLSLTKLRDSA